MIPLCHPRQCVKRVVTTAHEMKREMNLNFVISYYSKNEAMTPYAPKRSDIVELHYLSTSLLVSDLENQPYLKYFYGSETLTMNPLMIVRVPMTRSRFMVGIILGPEKSMEHCKLLEDNLSYDAGSVILYRLRVLGSMGNGIAKQSTMVSEAAYVSPNQESTPSKCSGADGDAQFICDPRPRLSFSVFRKGYPAML